MLCLRLTLLYLARTFALTHFYSKVLHTREFCLWGGCLPPSSLHDVKLSTRAEWPVFAIRAFVSRIGNKRLLQQIFLYQNPWKNKGLIHMQKPPALKNEEINRTRHPSDLPTELFPPVPTVFYMMLLNVFKEAIEILLFLKFLLFSSWTISIGGFW